MIATAPRSSAMATVVRNSLSEVGARLPSSASTPIAKAMSVAAGIAQPRAERRVARRRRRDRSAPGRPCPAAAAITGSRRRSQVASRPSTNSRLISSPTSRKKTAISPSLIQKWTVIGPWRGDSDRPDRRVQHRLIGMMETAIGDDQRQRRRGDQQDAARRLAGEEMAQCRPGAVAWVHVGHRSSFGRSVRISARRRKAKRSWTRIPRCRFPPGWPRDSGRRQWRRASSRASIAARISGATVERAARRNSPRDAGARWCRGSGSHGRRATAARPATTGPACSRASPASAPKRS